MTPAQERMERTIRRPSAASRTAPRRCRHAKIAAVAEAETRKAVAAALRSGRALTGFEPFGRAVERRYFVVTTRGGFELHASTESQECFSNAFLELLQSPRTRPSSSPRSGARRVLRQALTEGVVGCFSLAPSDDVGLAVGVSAERLPAHGPAARAPRRRRRAQGRNRVVAQAREPERRIASAAHSCARIVSTARALLSRPSRRPQNASECNDAARSAPELPPEAPGARAGRGDGSHRGAAHGATRASQETRRDATARPAGHALARPRLSPNGGSRPGSAWSSRRRPSGIAARDSSRRSPNGSRRDGASRTRGAPARRPASATR